MKATQMTALLFLLTATVHCGGAGDPSSSAAPDGSPATADFIGQYQSTWSATAYVTSPAGVPPQPYTDTAMITVTATDDADISMAWQVGSNAPSGTITFAVQGDSATATGIGTGGTCWTGVLTNGNQQTTCATTATAEIVGDQLSQRQTGTITGTTPDGVAYTGTYEGIWTGTRTSSGQ